MTARPTTSWSLCSTSMFTPASAMRRVSMTELAGDDLAHALHEHVAHGDDADPAASSAARAAVTSFTAAPCHAPGG